MARQQPEEIMTLKRALTARTQEGFLYEKLADKEGLGALLRMWPQLQNPTGQGRYLSRSV